MAEPTPESPTGAVANTKDGITLSSTTDDQATVDAALGIATDAEPAPVDETSGAPDPAPSDTAAESTEPTAASSDASEPQPKGTRAQKRIDTLTARNYEASKRIADLEAQLAAATATPAPPTTPADPLVRPVLEDFTTTDAYIEAVSDWKARAIVAENAESQATARADATTKAHHDSAMVAWSARVNEAKAAHADYAEVVGAASDEPMSASFQSILMQFERGGEMLYQIASQPGLATQINALSPVGITRALDAIDRELSPETPASPEVTPAPAVTSAPIVPVGSGAPETPKTPGEMNYAEYRAHREKTGRR